MNKRKVANLKSMVSIHCATSLGHFTINEFSLNICHYSKRAKTCHIATSCVRDYDATTASARHMLETGSLNWLQFSEFLRTSCLTLTSLHK